MRLLPILTLFAAVRVAYGQSESLFQKGQFQLSIAFSLMPIQKRDSEIKFRYVDGHQKSTYVLDTVTASYRQKQSHFGDVISIGLGYFVSKDFRASITLKPHLRSFLPNKAKNGEVYGIQFDIGLDYFFQFSKNANISIGTSASRILGGFGITSGAPKNKDYLVVNGNKLYDNDIGFHLVDNWWAISPRIGLNYRITDHVIFFANSGLQMTFNHSSSMNFAGFREDGTVKWNSKSFDDPHIDLVIDQVKISDPNIQNLPFKFSGLFFDFGTMINLNR